MKTLPTFSTYMYNGNYGAHAMKLNMGVFQLYYSYETIVAFDSITTGLVCSVNRWGNTTGKHLNCIEPNKKLRYNQSEFEEALAILLETYLNEDKKENE